jgi:hypothetical protein
MSLFYFLFFLLQNRRMEEQNRIVQGGVGTSERGEVVQKGVRKVNMVQKKCVHMYVNAKMIPVETIPGMGEEE